MAKKLKSKVKKLHTVTVEVTQSFDVIYTGKSNIKAAVKLLGQVCEPGPHEGTWQIAGVCSVRTNTVKPLKFSIPIE